MRRYDANRRPNPREWLALDEIERSDIVERFHRRHGDYGESLQAHAAIHCVIETQLAEKIEPVMAAFRRLRGEALNRHETIHAIGSVLGGFIFEILNGDNTSTDVNEDYFARLATLTKESWHASYDKDA